VALQYDDDNRKPFAKTERKVTITHKEMTTEKTNCYVKTEFRGYILVVWTIIGHVQSVIGELPLD
jgi:hypothetical protein